MWKQVHRISWNVLPWCVQAPSRQWLLQVPTVIVFASTLVEVYLVSPLYSFSQDSIAIPTDVLFSFSLHNSAAGNESWKKGHTHIATNCNIKATQDTYRPHIINPVCVYRNITHSLSASQAFHVYNNELVLFSGECSICKPSDRIQFQRFKPSGTLASLTQNSNHNGHMPP